MSGVGLSCLGWRLEHAGVVTRFGVLYLVVLVLFSLVFFWGNGVVVLVLGSAGLGGLVGAAACVCRWTGWTARKGWDIMEKGLAIPTCLESVHT